MKKIALVLFDWFPHGGLQRDCARIGQSLINSGAQVDVLCMTCEGDLPDGMTLIQPVLTGNTKVAQRRAFANFLQAHLADVAYDSVLGFNRLPGLDYYFAADTCFAWKATHERNWLYRLAPRNRQYLAFEKAVFAPQSTTTVFILSPLQKEEYLACYPHAGKRMVDIPPGIARDRMAGDDAEDLRQSVRQELNIAADEVLILQVGTGFPVKGVDRSLTAIAALPDALRSKVRFLLLGADKHNKYKNMADNLDIGSCVTVLDGRDDMPRMLQGADLLLQPSRKESAGMVLLEAIVAGLPVLTTETCGYAFHVRQSGAGCVIDEPFTQQALNEALLSMLLVFDKNSERSSWKQKGIQYGREGDFYAMPEKVAARVLEANGDDAHVS